MASEARSLLIPGVLIALLGALLARQVARVPDDEMAPSLLAGDWVVIVPVAPKPGDVVVVSDPLDARRWTLRRVLASEGMVSAVDGTVRVEGAPQPLLLMGARGAASVIQEGEHLIQRAERTVRWEAEPYLVPDGALYLAADNRDEALDSRWWGAVPAGAVQGVVVLRVGPPRHPWRGWLEGRSASAPPAG